MRLINPNDMVRALRTDTVRTWEVVLYASIYVIAWLGQTVSLIPASGILYVSYSSSALQFFDIVFMYGLLLIEIIVAYYINKKGDGKHYWRRYFALNASLFIPMIFAYMLLHLLWFGLPDYATSGVIGLSDVISTTILGLLFFVWFLHLMRRVSSVSEAE